MFNLSSDFCGRMRTLIIVFFLAALVMGQPASAELHVDKPEVAAGHLEFEIISGWVTGSPDGRDLEYLKQLHEAKLKLGINDYLQFYLGAGFEEEVEIEDGLKAPSSLNFTELELGIQLELLTIAQHGIGLALTGGFTAAQVDEESDSVNWGAITKLASGPVSLTTNVSFSDPRTDEAEEDHVNFDYAAQIKYQLNDLIALAAEAYGEIDNVYDPVDFDEQVHRAGPVVFVNLNRGEETAGHHHDEAGHSEGVGFKLGLGLLFGLTDTSPDQTIKAQFEAEF